MKIAGQDRKLGQKMSADKTNAARTRYYNKKQEKNLVCDKQLDDEVTKTDEGADHWVYYSEEGCEILAMLWLPQLLPKRYERTMNHSSADIVLLENYSLSETVKPESLLQQF